MPKVSFDIPAHGTTSSNTSSKDRPNTPWRTDNPRQQTPFSARPSGALFSRQSTPRVSEITMDDVLEESYEDTTEHIGIDELEEAASFRAKDNA
jgi:hypothetical protein